MPYDILENEEDSSSLYQPPAAPTQPPDQENILDRGASVSIDQLETEAPVQPLTEPEPPPATPPPSRTADQQEPEYEILTGGYDRPEKLERGLVGDVVTAAGRGIGRAIESTGAGVETLGAETTGQFWKEKGREMAESELLRADDTSLTGKEGTAKRTFISALESLPSSLVPLATGAFGAAVGSLAGPGGTLYGGYAGAAAGLGTTFGAGTYGLEKDRYLKEAADPELTKEQNEQEAHDFALSQALWETIPEAASDLVAAGTFGVSKLLMSGLGATGAVVTLKGLLSQGPKAFAQQFGKAYLKSMPVEALSEMVTYWGQASGEREAGLGDGPIAQGFIDAAATAVWMTAMMGGGMSVYSQRAKNRISRAIQSDNPVMRSRAADQVQKGIAAEYGEEQAQAWRDSAEKTFAEGGTIDMSSPVFSAAQETTPVEAAAQAERNTGVLTRALSSVGEAVDVGGETITSEQIQQMERDNTIAGKVAAGIPLTEEEEYSRYSPEVPATTAAPSAGQDMAVAQAPVEDELAGKVGAEVSMALSAMVRDLASAEAGRRIQSSVPQAAPYSAEAGAIVRQPSSFPAWVTKDKVLSRAGKKSIQLVISKVMAGDKAKLTPSQADLWERIESAAKEELNTNPELVSGQEADKLSKEGFELGATEEISVGSLNPGDEVVVTDAAGIPDKLTHKGFDKDGHAILKDGVTMKVDPFEQIAIIGKKIGPEGDAVSQRMVDFVTSVNVETRPKVIRDLIKETPKMLAGDKTLAPYADMVSGALSRRIAELEPGKGEEGTTESKEKPEREGKKERKTDEARLSERAKKRAKKKEAPAKKEVPVQKVQSEEKSIRPEQKVLEDLGEGMTEAARADVAKSIRAGKADRLTLRRPEAVAAALKDDKYNVVENDDGSVTIIGVKTGGEWVGVGPKEGAMDLSIAPAGGTINVSSVGEKQGIEAKIVSEWLSVFKQDLTGPVNIKVLTKQELIENINNKDIVPAALRLKIRKNSGMLSKAVHGFRWHQAGQHLIVSGSVSGGSLASLKNLSALAHEVGHVVETEFFNNAPESTKKKIISAHAKWVEENEKDISAGKLSNQKRLPVGQAIGVPRVGVFDVGKKTPTGQPLTEYLLSFKEWFANETAKALTSSSKPIGVVDKFFADLADVMRRLAKKITGTDFVPDAAVANFVLGGDMLIDDKIAAAEENKKRVGYGGSSLDFLTSTQVESFRKANDLPEIKLRKDGSHPTQIATTKSTYRKIFDNIMPKQVQEGKILDFGAGKNIGGKELNADTFEPFPEKGFKPTFSDSKDIPSNSYDGIINNAVLNVVPDDVRHAIVKEIGRILTTGGSAYINVRGKDVFSANHIVIDKDNMEVIIKGSGAYQKGFTKPELKTYIESVLGDGFDVRIAKGGESFGAVGVIVDKQYYASVESDSFDLLYTPEPMSPRAKAMLKEAKAGPSEEKYDDFFEGKGRETSARVAARETKGLISDAGATVDRFLGAISSRIRKWSRELEKKLRRMEMDIMKDIHDYTAAVEPLMNVTREKMTPKDYSDWKLARYDSDKNKIDHLVKKYSIEDEYKAARNTIDSLKDLLTDAGFDIDNIDEYWPRAIKDTPGLLRHMERGDMRPVFSDAMKAKAKQMGVEVSELTEADRAKAASSVILGRGYGPSGPTSSKERVFKSIPQELVQYYFDPDAAMIAHIREAVTASGYRKFFGNVGKKMAEVRTRLEKIEKKLSRKNLSLEDKSELEDAAQELRQTLARNEQGNFSQSVGELVSELAAQGLPAEGQKEIRDTLMARFHERGTSGAVRAYKNLSLIDTMGSFASALTQIGDFASPAYNAGLLETGRALGRAIKGNQRISAKELGADDIAEEFTDAGKIGEAVNKIFKLTGLSKMNTVARDTFLNSAFEQFKKEAKGDQAKLKAKIKPMFLGETDSVVQDLLNDDVTDNVRLLVFDRLLDFQPVTKSEMPEKYLTAGNGRLFYSLKSYTIKQFDIYRREIVTGLKSDSKQERIQALKNMTRLGMFLVLANASADELKDFLLIRESTLQDRVVDNILRLAGISRFVTWQARREGVGSAAAKQILPPFKFADALTKDILSAGDEKGLKTIDSVPLVGKLAYWWWGQGSDKKHDIWEIRYNKEKQRVNRFNDRLEKAKDKKEFISDNKIDFILSRRIRKFQGRLNRNKKMINRLESLEPSKKIHARIDLLKDRRSEMTRTFLGRLK